MRLGKKIRPVLAYKNNISCMPSSCFAKILLGKHNAGCKRQWISICRASLSFLEQLLYCLLPHPQKPPVTVTERSWKYKKFHYFNSFVSENDYFTAGFFLVYRGKGDSKKSFELFWLFPQSCPSWSGKIIVLVPWVALRDSALSSAPTPSLSPPTPLSLCSSLFPILIPSAGPEFWP